MLTQAASQYRHYAFLPSVVVTYLFVVTVAFCSENKCDDDDDDVVVHNSQLLYVSDLWKPGCS